MQDSKGLVTYVVSDADRHTWFESVRDIKFPEWGPYSDFVAAVKEAGPSDVAESMQHLRENKCWGIHFVNLPSDPHPSEATGDGCRPRGNESVSGAVSVGLGGSRGEP